MRQKQSPMGCSASSERAALWASAVTHERGDAVDFHQRYTLGSKLGEGSFGQVRAAIHRSSREIRAVKILSLRSEDDSAVRSLLLSAKREAKIWRLLGNHVHTVKLYESYVDHSVYYMVMEKCDASLMDHLQELPRMSERKIARVFREMLLGIGHVHSHNVVHRDVKPNNFLFGGPSAGTVKLCDFGMASVMPRRGGLLFGSCGTAPYMSPEMIGDKGHGLGTDVWSFGASAYMLLYGDFPYLPAVANAKAMKQVVLRGHPAPKYERCSKDMQPPSELAKAFVQKLLERDPRERVTIQKALHLAFLRREAVPEGLVFPSADAVAAEAKASVGSIAPPAGASSRAKARAQRQAAGGQDTLELPSLPVSAQPSDAAAGDAAAKAHAAPAAAVPTAATTADAAAAAAADAAAHVREKLRRLGEVPVEEEGLAPVIREARKRTHQFKAPICPTVQRSLDELIAKLQEASGQGPLARSFSGPAAGGDGCETEEGGEASSRKITRRESRGSTHSGVLRMRTASTTCSQLSLGAAPAGSLRTTSTAASLDLWVFSPRDGKHLDALSSHASSSPPEQAAAEL